MTPEYLLDLQQQLPELHFDKSMDQLSSDWSLCQKYLTFYNLPELSGVKHFLGKFQAQDYHLACHYWVPDNAIATVVVVHGYFDHVGLYGHLVEYLLGKHYAVVAFDLPGHGLSSGERVSIESFHHYVQVFSVLLDNIKGLPKPFHGVGQSTGGAIILNYLLTQYLANKPVGLETVVLLAPLIRPTHWLKGKIMYAFVRRLRGQVNRNFQRNSSDDNFVEFLKQDPLQSKYLSFPWVAAMKQWIDEFNHYPDTPHPVTVIQGNLDTTVDGKFNCAAINRKFPNADIHWIKDARHHLVNEVANIRQQVFAAMPL